MVRPSHDPFVEGQSLPRQLQQKSRRRRKDLLELAKASTAPRKRRNDLLPQLELVSIRLDELHLPERKTSKATPAHVREVMGAISALGFCAPILVGKGNLVLGGEIRVEAAKALGLATVPCIRIDHLTDEEQRTLPRFPIAPHHCRHHRWHRAGGSDGHRPRQSPALFLGRAGAEVRAPL
jgi:hypothetical protein